MLRDAYAQRFDRSKDHVYSPLIGAQLFNEIRIVSNRLELSCPNLTSKVGRPVLLPKVVDLELKTAIFVELQCLRDTLPPRSQKLIDREQPHLGLGGKERELINRNTVALNMLSRGLRLDLNQKVIDDRNVRHLHRQVGIIAKKA